MKRFMLMSALSAVAALGVAAPESYIIQEKLYRLDHDTGRSKYYETRPGTVIIDRDLYRVTYISNAGTEYFCNDPKIGKTNFSARFNVPGTAFVITGSYKAGKGKKLKGEYIWNNSGYYLTTKFKGVKAL